HDHLVLLSFPTRRSSDLDWPAFFSDPWPGIKLHIAGLFRNPEWVFPALRWLGASLHGLLPDLTLPDLGFPDGGSSFPELDFSIRDRKSTRLNSSHVKISY